MISDDWDGNTVFLREDEFKMLGLPIGTRVRVVVRDTNKSRDNMILSLDSRPNICSVRLGKLAREDLGLDDDVLITQESARPNHEFDIIETSPPRNKESAEFQGRVCKIEGEMDEETVFLKAFEFKALGVPAGTTVSVTVLDTGRTAEKVTLVDTDIETCVVRLSKSLREALGVADDTEISPVSSRPIRTFIIRLPQP
jgi:hypothetical protein